MQQLLLRGGKTFCIWTPDPSEEIPALLQRFAAQLVPFPFRVGDGGFTWCSFNTNTHPPQQKNPLFSLKNKKSLSCFSLKKREHFISEKQHRFVDAERAKCSKDDRLLNGAAFCFEDTLLKMISPPELMQIPTNDTFLNRGKSSARRLMHSFVPATMLHH